MDIGLVEIKYFIIEYKYMYIFNYNMNICHYITLIQRAWRKKKFIQKIKCGYIFINRIRRECECCGIFTLNKNQLCYECNNYSKV